MAPAPCHSPSLLCSASLWVALFSGSLPSCGDGHSSSELTPHRPRITKPLRPFPDTLAPGWLSPSDMSPGCACRALIGRMSCSLEAQSWSGTHGGRCRGWAEAVF